jgi:hypothetical protein
MIIINLPLQIMIQKENIYFIQQKILSAPSIFIIIFHLNYEPHFVLLTTKKIGAKKFNLFCKLIERLEKFMEIGMGFYLNRSSVCSHEIK